MSFLKSSETVTFVLIELIPQPVSKTTEQKPFQWVSHCCAFGYRSESFLLCLGMGLQIPTRRKVRGKGWSWYKEERLKALCSMLPLLAALWGWGEKMATCCCWGQALSLQQRQARQQHPGGSAVPGAQHQVLPGDTWIPSMPPGKKWCRVSTRENQAYVCHSQKKQCTQNEAKLAIGSTCGTSVSNTETTCLIGCSYWSWLDFNGRLFKRRPDYLKHLKWGFTSFFSACRPAITDLNYVAFTKLLSFFVLFGFDQF